MLSRKKLLLIRKSAYVLVKHVLLLNLALSAAVSATAAELKWDASLGLGYNSNIYRAPSDSYIDYAPATPVPVVPEVHSGIFIPLEFDTKYQRNISQDNNLKMEYDFSGEFFTDSKYSNANEMSHTIDIGDELILAKKKRRKDTFYGGIILENKKKEYTERDTGLDKFSTGGVNISDRYPYTGAGIKLEYDKNISKIRYGLKFEYIKRDYKDAIAISQLDHNYYMLRGDVKIPVDKASKVRLKYKHYSYDYKERPSRDLNGRAFTSYPPLNYVYDEFVATYIYNFNRDVRTFIDYSYRIRSDKYVGYNDYQRQKIKIRTLYNYSKKIDLKFTLSYWDKKYPNAYAFDRFVTGANEDQKHYDSLKLKFEGDYAVNDHQSYWINFEWRKVNTTDLRYQYNRAEVMAGVKWSY